MRKIILCDDEAHILYAAEFKFKHSGYQVRCASDGEQGWKLIQEDLPDVVLTDCQMPNLDGIGLAQRIHNDPQTTHLPVIMLTAKGFELSAAEIRRKYNILDVIAKPFSPRELVGKVDELLAAEADVVG